METHLPLLVKDPPGSETGVTHIQVAINKKEGSYPQNLKTALESSDFAP
jgi:hypothetical protein